MSSEVNEVAVSALEKQTPGPSPVDEKPLPPPPEEPTWSAAALPAPMREAPVTTPSPAPGPPRLKKRVPWKGKNIMVLLPWDDERGQRGKAPAPMTQQDVVAMLREWEQLGYDTTGFNLGHSPIEDGEGGEGQSRSSWPHSADLMSERKTGSYNVSIPDKKDWNAYVTELAEAKLRALGVTVGDEKPSAVVSPTASSMSRQTSMQYPPLPFSPPLPTASAGSSHLSGNVNLFSPSLVPGAGPSTSQSSNPGSIASPASIHAQLQGKFNPRQSVSFSAGEHPFGSPFQYPHQIQSPGVWSPQQMLHQQGGPRGGSPSLQNIGAMVSPSPPFSQDGYFPQGDVMSQLHQRQQLLQNQLHQQQQQQLQLQGGARASPRLQDVHESPDEEVPSKSPSKTPEAAHIKHNPSSSLQKEIDDAEYHLEEQFERQLEHDDYSPHSELAKDQLEDLPSPNANNSKEAFISALDKQMGGLSASKYAVEEEHEDGPVLHHPQPHSRGHSLSQRPFQDNGESLTDSKSGQLDVENTKGEVSDIETNPSNLGTPIQSFVSNGHDRSFSMASDPWKGSEQSVNEDAPAPRRSGHSAKPSVSKLNVEAKEFKFDPTSSFTPEQSIFGGSGFQPSSINAYASFAPPQSATSSHFSNHSINSGKNKINVDAPVFTPGNSEFSFSASGPAFRPDAPAFTPINFSESVGSVNSGSDAPGARTSIFGNIDISALGISKPSKKSKAIPIIRPDSSHSRILEDDVVIGKDGRITQGESRIKRARGEWDDGDSIPLFAEPSLPLVETTRGQSPPKDAQLAAIKPIDKENSAPLSGGEEARYSLEGESISTVDKTLSPLMFQQKKKSEDLSGAKPLTSKRYGSGLSAYGHFQPSEDEPAQNIVPSKPEPKKVHKRNSLSATAKPFISQHGSPSFSFEPVDQAVKDTTESSAEEEKSDKVLTPKLAESGGLSASRYARSPTPSDNQDSETDFQPNDVAQFQASLPQPDSLPMYAEDHMSPTPGREPTFEEIDAVMRAMNDQDAESAMNREKENSPRWHQPSPARLVQVPDLDNSSPIRLQPQNLMRSDAPSPSPSRYQALPGEISQPQQQRIFSRGNDADPFAGAESPEIPMLAYGSPVHHLNRGSSLPLSDWDDVLSETEEAKLLPRAQFFDNHVNDLVGGLLDERLNPLEKTLETIQMAIEMMANHAQSNRRDRRSNSGALSDADDEDEDEVPRRSLSPRRDKKLEKIRSIVTEALNAHNPIPQTALPISAEPGNKNILQVLEEMKEQFGQSMRLDFRAEDLKNVVEDAVENRMQSPKPVIDEATMTRDADQKARIAELEGRLTRAEESVEGEISNRRAAEDRLAEVQRLLRISSEEEDRLRDAMEQRESKIREIVDEKDEKVVFLEEQRAKTAMQVSLLEAAQENASKSAMEHQNRINIQDTDIREARQQAHHWQMEAERALESARVNSEISQELPEAKQQIQHWQMEAERALEAARRHSEDAEMANETNRELRRTIERLRSQMEESIRVREGMRGKLIDLQEEMASAAQSISGENERRFKKEQELVARQEVLDARLQAEARTRERLEQEIERLEKGEREGMRAMSECKRMEATIAELKQESHLAEKDAMRYQREFEEARETGLGEVQRTRMYMQAEIESANNQVNVVREDLEHQLSRLRNDSDQVKLDADATQQKNEMLLEEAEMSKSSAIDDIKRKHSDAVEDMQAQHERLLNNAIEDAQRSEQHLLERLSLSSAKTEHLQDRVAHLEDKLEIANQAANAAAVAAKSARSVSSSSTPTEVTVPITAVKQVSKALELPEKISPQALRESIMVLQEQLQDREQTVEKLEAKITELDPEASSKISKRDDEILWLRELLSVRKGDLTDIVQALEGDEWDGDRVKDAAIRLRANLQMEEQERERALNGGSALNLPNIAMNLRDAASPRVAQAVGPLAAAWGNWRKGRDSNASDIKPDRSHSSTPSRASIRRSGGGGQNILSGLITPPASSTRTPGGSVIPAQRRESGDGAGGQPTAFGSTGQRFTREQLANRPPARGTKGKAAPSTPPMMRTSSYDADATTGDFSDTGFYDDDESTVDDHSGILVR